MPGGGVVIDAFKNLIRHGKNAQPSSAPAPAQPTNASTSGHHSRQQQEYAQAQHQQAQQQQQAGYGGGGVQGYSGQNRQQGQAMNDNLQAPSHQGGQQHNQAPLASPDYQREAQQIVREEREQREKMPNYPGLEGFKLVEKMGDGAFSNVYKAIDRTSGQKVAVKVVRKYELNATQSGNKHLNPNFKKRPRVTERANILKEVQIMRGTNHPNIIKLISFSESDEHYFLVLELMEGGELFHQIVKLTYFSEELSRHVIMQVADGIRYLH